MTRNAASCLSLSYIHAEELGVSLAIVMRGNGPATRAMRGKVSSWAG